MMDPVSAYKAARIAGAVASRLPWRKIAVAVVATLALVGFGAMGLVSTLSGANNEQLSAGQGSCVTINPGVTSEDLNASQLANAAVIVTIGQQLGIPERGWIVGIATAMQESKMDNTLTPAQSDRDSAGMFQQRAPWGPLTDRMDAAASTRMFYTGGQGGQPGLLDYPDWPTWPVTVAAQRVQVSGFPTAYAQWEQLAIETVAKLTSVADPIADSAPEADPSPSPSAGPTPPAEQFADAAARCGGGITAANWTNLPGESPGELAVNAAARWLGQDYSWGGGTLDGPSTGIAQGAGTIGFDCSALVRYSWWQAARIQLPRTARVIAANTTEIAPADIQAGDILSFDTMGGGVTHDGLADGRGGMIHAPKTGDKISIVPNILKDKYYAPKLLKISRPSSLMNQSAG